MQQSHKSTDLKALATWLRDNAATCALIVGFPAAVVLAIIIFPNVAFLQQKETTLSAVGAIVSAVAAVISIVIAYCGIRTVARQLKETRLATYAQTYNTAVTILQREKVRQSRQTLYNLAVRLEKNPDTEWYRADNADYKAEHNAAQQVCHTYDSIAIMVRHGMLPEEIVLERWGGAILRSWAIVKPFVNYRREQLHSPQHWASLVWLAEQAEKWWQGQGVSANLDKQAILPEDDEATLLMDDGEAT